MAQLIQSIISAVLEWLGIDQKQQFLWLLLALIAMFVVYMIRARHNDKLLSMIFVTMAVAFVVFLFTESAEARWASAAVVVATVPAAFAAHATRNWRKSGGA